MNPKLKTSIFILAGLLLLSYALSFAFSASSLAIGNAALIDVHGVISSQGGSFLSQEAVSSDIVELIESAEKDSQIKAIVLDIDSPGGTPVASAEIAEAIKKANKTTVAWIHESGTSGAYWIASAADVIVAHPLSLTGSIGVTGSYLEFSGLLERYNITYERLVSGNLKDIGSPYKELSPKERAEIQKIIDEMHQEFVQAVAENRNLSVQAVENLATGNVYTGKNAKNLGLVDVLGGKDEVISAIKQKENLSDVSFAKYEKRETLLDVFASAISKQSFSIGQGIGSILLNQQSGIRI